ncbi:MAG: DUF362 domain-containing protein, partial [Deltaproteobacteria bacterium]|nr:DUF362 domain-containing protein [Deltaproteobacteria bacterium]
MKSVVSIRRCGGYETDHLALTLERVLGDLGGAHSFFRRGDQVLLKPNLLASASPERALVTHPAFVEAVATMVIDCGATPFLGDSPPLGKLSRVLTKSGYDPFMKRLGVQP